MNLILIALIVIILIVVYQYFEIKKNLSFYINKSEHLQSTIDTTKAELTKHRNETFRVGDMVYTNDNKFELNKPYYIIQIYGGLGGMCAIINSDKEADKNKSWSCLSYGVSLENLQHKQYPKCPKCNQNL